MLTQQDPEGREHLQVTPGLYIIQVKSQMIVQVRLIITSCTIATSLIHSKLDYCNSLYLNISNLQLNRLQLVLNSAACAVTKNSKKKFHHITPHLKSLPWLKITQRIQYKILSLTYKSLQYNKPSSISDLLTIQPTRSTRSSAVVTLQRPSNPSRLKISDRSFYFQAPALWNALPHHLRSHSPSSQSHSLLSLSSSQFHKQLKTHLFLHSYPPYLASLYWTDPLEFRYGLFVIRYSFRILHPRSVHLLTSFKFYVCHIVCRNKLTGIQ